MKTKVEIEVALAEAVKHRYAEAGVEYMVGALSSVTTIEQLIVLLDSLTESPNEN
jgi:hypothetical protein